MARVVLLLTLPLLELCLAEIPHEDPGIMFRHADKDRTGDLDADELDHFFSHTEQYSGKVIADTAGGKKNAVNVMDTNKNGKICADEFLAHVSPSFHKAVAVEDFTTADQNEDGFLDLSEYKNSHYGVERVPNFVDEGFAEHFKQLDLNHDGKLSKEEYLTPASKDTFAQMDYNNDNIVTYDEFRKHKHTHYYSENKDAVPPEADNTKAGFAQFDLNHDGKITRSEDAFALMPKEGEAHVDDHDDDNSWDEGAED